MKPKTPEQKRKSKEERKSQEEIYLPQEEIDQLKSQSLPEQFARDGEVLTEYLTNGRSPARDALKRMLLLAQHSDISVRNGTFLNGKEVTEKNKHLTEADFSSLPEATKDLPEETAFKLQTLFLRGGRLTGVLPPLKIGEDKDAFIKWLLGDALEGRKFASHGVDARGFEELYDPKSPTGIAKIMKNAAAGVNFGVDLGLLSPGGVEDGRHGHIYIYFNPPTKDKPGGYLLSVENSRSGESDIFRHTHDAKATSPLIAPGGSLKYRDQSYDTYEYTSGNDNEVKTGYPIRPARENGLRTKHSTQEMQHIYQLTADDFNVADLNNRITTKKDPAQTVEESQKKKAAIAAQAAQQPEQQPEQQVSKESNSETKPMHSTAKLTKALDPENKRRVSIGRHKSPDETGPKNTNSSVETSPSANPKQATEPEHEHVIGRQRSDAVTEMPPTEMAPNASAQEKAEPSAPVTKTKREFQIGTRQSVIETQTSKTVGTEESTSSFRPSKS